MTDKQQEASRANGRLSQGPKTPEGKAISSQNAIKSGFFAKNPILPGESAEEYRQLRDQAWDTLAPEGAYEELLAERIIADTWRLRRIPGMEHGLLEAHVDDGHPLLGVLSEPRASLAFQRLLRYEAMLYRHINSTLKELKRLQKERGAVAPPVAVVEAAPVALASRPAAPEPTAEVQGAQAAKSTLPVQNEPETRPDDSTSRLKIPSQEAGPIVRAA